jgi:hypothetical protein
MRDRHECCDVYWINEDLTMRFYYFSLFSWMAYAVVVFIAIALLWLLWTKMLKLKIRNPVFWGLVAAIIVGPWGEELWIAYNFDRLCRKDAGVFINKTVEVDGYYNDTGTVTRLVGGPPYKFIESPERDGGFRRVERASDEEKARALAWYAQKNAGKQPAENDWVTQPVSDRVQVTVEVSTGYAWRITKLDKPTARYQYKTLNSHTPVAYQVKRFEDVVIDNQTGEVLGRYTNYYRGPYWFYISLGVETIPCEETEADVRKHGTLSVFALTLRPSK